MSTVYTAARPLPWCDRCQQHQVLTAGALCPVCTDDGHRCRRCGHVYPWRGGISFGAVCELGRLVREHYTSAHPGVEVAR